MKKGLISVVSALTGIIAGAGFVGKIENDRQNKMLEISEKRSRLFLLMNQWVKVKQEDKNLSKYFARNGYKKIAVYGMSYVGETLINELSNTEVEIVYGIDQNAESIYANVDVVSVEEPLKEVDAVIVTAITSFDDIAEKLSQKLSCPILSLEDILYEI